MHKAGHDHVASSLYPAERNVNENKTLHFSRQMFLLKETLSRVIVFLAAASASFILLSMVHAHAQGSASLDLPHTVAQADNLNDTIRELNERLGENENNPVILNMLGEIYLGMNLPEEARRFYERALDTDGSDLVAGKGLGRALRLLGEQREAIARFERLRKHAPQDQEILGHLADLYHETGDLVEAETLHRQLLDLDSENNVVRLSLGILLLEQGRLGEAAAVLEETVEREPQSLLGRLNLAMVYSELGRFHDAVVEANKAISAHPENPDGYRMLGIFYFEKDVFSEAIRFLERVLALNPLDTEVRVGLAIAYQAEGRASDAVAEIERALETQGDSYDLLILLANLLMEQERHGEAAEVCTRAIDIDEDRLDAHYLLGLAWEALGDQEKAQEEFEKVKTQAAADSIKATAE